jgi:hypothetical protein
VENLSRLSRPARQSGSVRGPLYPVGHSVRANARKKLQAQDTLGFASYLDRIADATAHPQVLPPGANPFPVQYARRSSRLQFNIHHYAHQLLNDFRLAGGQIVMRKFHSPSELTQRKEKVAINCTGYGARTLWKDESIMPVRSQIGWLLPKPEVVMVSFTATSRWCRVPTTSWFSRWRAGIFKAIMTTRARCAATKPTRPSA